jgi:hypothetical protein
MISFRAIGMPAAEASRCRAASHDHAGNAIIAMASTGAAPCRFTLTDHAEGVAMRLLSWPVPQPAGPYALHSPIFLSATGGAGWDAVDVVPPVVASRQVALRAYAANGMMVYAANRLVLDDSHAEAIRATLALPGVAFINIHTALAGCYLCRAEPA